MTPLKLALVVSFSCGVALNWNPVLAASSGSAEAKPAVSSGEAGPLRVARPASGTNVVLNFRGAPLEVIIEHLAEASGFRLVRETEVKGTANLYSSRPVTPEEALNLLHSVLLRNDYAAIRSDKVLTIVNRDEAKTRGVPVRLGNDPQTIPDTAEISTQIIPVRHVEVNQLIKDLQPLASPRTTMTADEAANALVITDVQSAIRRLVQVIQGIDQAARNLSAVRVFKLQHADPQETADLLSELFPDPNASRRGPGLVPQAGSPAAPGNTGASEGPEGNEASAAPPAGPFAERLAGLLASQAAQADESNGSQRLQKNSRVVAVADQRTSAVVVSASETLMRQIESIIASLDTNDAGKQSLRMYQIQNGSPGEITKVLRDLFERGTVSGTAAETVENDVLRTRSTAQSEEQINGWSTGGDRANRPSRYGSGATFSSP